VRTILILIISSIAVAQPVSVSKQIPFIKKICEVFERDGRAQFVFKQLSETPLKDPRCPACTPLSVAFRASCKPQGKGEPNKPQRDPHPALLYWSTLLGESINEDKNSGLIWQAFEKLLVLLTGNFPGRSPAEREYFETFQHFLLENKLSEKEPLDLPKVNVDNLFE
jgi:hypothetical protein